MAKTADTPLAQTLKRLMDEAGTNPKRLSREANLNETYVRDIVAGRSKSPEARRLAALARALGVDVGILLQAAEPNTGELISDPKELILLRTWRYLSEDAQTQAMNFLEFLIDGKRQARTPAVGE
jgi:transcriptional regulator with XRE-family HTH domain